MSGSMIAFRAVAAINGFAAGALVLLFWGLGMTFWSLVGLAIALMAFSSGFMAARRDYIEAATPSALAGVVVVFVQMPPEGFILLAVILLFVTAGLAFILYEVD